eukprot:s118_g29.t1
MSLQSPSSNREFEDVRPTAWPWQHFMLCCSSTAWFYRGLARLEPGLASTKTPMRDLSGVVPLAESWWGS